MISNIHWDFLSKVVSFLRTVEQTSSLRLERARPLWPWLPQNFQANPKGHYGQLGGGPWPWLRLTRRPYIHAQILNGLLNAHSDFCVCGREPCQHATRGVPLCFVTLFLGVHGVMVRWPWTEGTANNERVHSFCWFLPNPFIQDLFLWHIPVKKL